MEFKDGHTVVRVCYDPNDRFDYGVIVEGVVVKVPRYMQIIEPLDNGSILVAGMVTDNSYAAIGIVNKGGLEILAHSSHYDTEDGVYVAAGENLPLWQEEVYSSPEYPYIEKE